MLLTIKYTIFAILATAVNIGAQDLSIRLYDGPWGLHTAMIFGTLVGLLLKFILDKYYIFFDQSKGISGNSKQFILYSFMGIATTIIFWATELSFDYFFKTKTMRYTGALIGLTIGYLVKYRLDKQFVFTKVKRVS